MKNLVKYSYAGSLIFLFIGSSNSSLIAETIGMRCQEKFRKKNQEITHIKYDKNIDGIGFNYKILKVTIALNNEPGKKCIASLYI